MDYAIVLACCTLVAPVIFELLRPIFRLLGVI